MSWEFWLLSSPRAFSDFEHGLRIKYVNGRKIFTSETNKRKIVVCDMLQINKKIKYYYWSTGGFLHRIITQLQSGIVVWEAGYYYTEQNFYKPVVLRKQSCVWLLWQKYKKFYIWDNRNQRYMHWKLQSSPEPTQILNRLKLSASH